MAGSCVSATEWVAGSCVSVPMVGIGKDPRAGEVKGVLGISQIGGESRVVATKGGLVELLVRFFCKKGGKRGVCFCFWEGCSSMMGQEGLFGSESSLRIWRAGVEDSGVVCGGSGMVGGLVGCVGGLLGISGESEGFCGCCS
jgi:hypothetical protein